jgi:tetratricopeptide (TPR) repeat protein
MILSALFLSVFLAERPIDAAHSQFDAGNYKAVVATLKPALDQSPSDAELHHWMARSYYELHSYDDAVTHAEAAVKLDPQNSEFSRWLGRIYGAKAELSHSFFLARKVKQAFEAAVRLAPASIAARRDLLQYCLEAPWIVGGDKDKARQQVEAISAIDSVQGHLAKAAFLAGDKQWKLAESEYVSVVDQHPSQIDAYMEAAGFFADRKDQKNLEKTLDAASRIDSRDPRLGYYHAVALILRGTDLPTAEQLLKGYISNVPEKSDYPSHHSASDWLQRIGH